MKQSIPATIAALFLITVALAIVRESDGKVLSSLDDAKHFWCVYLWGDRFSS